MFIIIVTIAAQEDNIEEFFQYELTRKPMSLFKNEMMRKSDKASMKKVIMPEKNVIKKEDITKCGAYVIDGGALLHRVIWSKDIKFSVITETYVKYVTRHYNDSNVTIVFDGYDNESMKGHEHLRRNSVPQSWNTFTAANINAENHVSFAQDCFLNNTENKSRLIVFLPLHLKRRGFIVINCPSDVDATIVKNALQYVIVNSGTIIILADDTDVAVMLVDHWEVAIQDIYFLEEQWNKAWSVKDAFTRNVVIKEDLLFLHSWSRYDSTSAVFGKGKPEASQMLAKSNDWKHLAETVSSPYSDQADVGNASLSKLLRCCMEKKMMIHLQN